MINHFYKRHYETTTWLEQNTVLNYFDNMYVYLLLSFKHLSKKNSESGAFPYDEQIFKHQPHHNKWLVPWHKGSTSNKIQSVRGRHKKFNTNVNKMKYYNTVSSYENNNVLKLLQCIVTITCLYNCTLSYTIYSSMIKYLAGFNSLQYQTTVLSYE